MARRGVRGRSGRRSAGIPRVRPTQSRVRDALFNSLGPRVQGARILDLFAGSGALGLGAHAPGGLIAAEGHWRDRPEAAPGFVRRREARYGETALWFYEAESGGEHACPWRSTQGASTRCTSGTSTSSNAP